MMHWWHLDLVPIRADRAHLSTQTEIAVPHLMCPPTPPPDLPGKLQALEYVRKLYGFPLGSTVACGDSGNDILMLAGGCWGRVRGSEVRYSSRGRTNVA